MAIIFPNSARTVNNPNKKIKMSNLSWSEISQISRSGKAKEYFSLGDEKSILIDNKPYIVRIIDFDHDRVVDTASYGRDTAGITFDLKNIFDSPVTTYFEYENEAIDIFEIISRYLDTVFPTITNTLTDNIVSVYRPQYETGGGGSNLSASSSSNSWKNVLDNYTRYDANKYTEKIFVPSSDEYSGKPDFDGYPEIYQYEYYKQGGPDSLIKYESDSSQNPIIYLNTHILSNYDTGSSLPRVTGSKICCINKNGKLDIRYASYISKNPWYISFAFCI